MGPAMHTVIAGGTGFLGRTLATTLAGEGHTVTVLTRKPAAPGPRDPVRHVQWMPDGTVGPWAATLNGATAVVNLAGESIAAKRWTAGQKQRILDSRVQATRSLVDAIAHASPRPAVLISGSAVGYYGPRGDEPVTEDDGPGADFLARVAIEWENEAMRAEQSLRVVRLRTGLVLERSGGALPKMLPPFWFGAGGPVGTGRQYWPWIHRRDWVDLVRVAIVTDSLAGPLNATAPNPVTNAEFARALGRALHRPAFMPAPGFALKLMLGEMADALLLSGQRAVPARAERLGHRFSFATVDAALRAIFAH
jgi:uncharacterized protein (TIGR01777 family)